MATLTLDQKRLEQLRTQLYGKQYEPKSSKKAKQESADKEPSKKESHAAVPHTGTESYIKKDLTKVFVLSSFILLLQLAVYYALANNWLSINIYGITY